MIFKCFRAGVPKWWAAKSSERAAGLFSKAVIGRSYSEKIKLIIKISFFISNLNFPIALKRFNDFYMHKNDNL